MRVNIIFKIIIFLISFVPEVCSVPCPSNEPEKFSLAPVSKAGEKENFHRLLPDDPDIKEKMCDFISIYKANFNFTERRPATKEEREQVIRLLINCIDMEKAKEQVSILFPSLEINTQYLFHLLQNECSENKNLIDILLKYLDREKFLKMAGKQDIGIVRGLSIEELLNKNFFYCYLYYLAGKPAALFVTEQLDNHYILGDYIAIDKNQSNLPPNFAVKIFEYCFDLMKKTFGEEIASAITVIAECEAPSFADRLSQGRILLHLRQGYQLVTALEKQDRLPDEQLIIFYLPTYAGERNNPFLLLLKPGNKLSDCPSSKISITLRQSDGDQTKELKNINTIRIPEAEIRKIINMLTNAETDILSRPNTPSKPLTSFAGSS